MPPCRENVLHRFLLTASHFTYWEGVIHEGETCYSITWQGKERKNGESNVRIRKKRVKTRGE